MTDIFDTRYDVEMRELIFPEHNKNKFIDGKWFMLSTMITKQI